MTHDARSTVSSSALVSTDDVAVALAPWDSPTQAGSEPGLCWRHVATLLLLLLTLPVLLTGALLALPALVLVAAAEGLRKALVLHLLPHNASFHH